MRATMALRLAGIALGGSAAAVTVAMSGPLSSARTITLQSVGSSLNTSSASSPSSTTTNNGNTDPNTGCNSNGNCNGLPKDFGVSMGVIPRLYPTASKAYSLTFTNPYAFSIYVTQATPAVSLSSTPSRPGCAASYVTAPAKTFVGAGLEVPRNSSVSTTMSLQLSNAAPDACQGAAWTVTVTAQAVK